MMDSRLIYVLMMMVMLVSCQDSIVTPSPPMDLPAEGNSYQVITPPNPQIMYEMSPCADKICASDEECVLAMNGAGLLRAYCQPTSGECDDVTGCRLVCTHGLEKDSRGCPFCACSDPCMTVKCGERMECIAEKLEEVSVGVCKPISDCLLIACGLKCEWGYGKDSFGCDMCACHDPCQQEFSCEGGVQCERVFNPDTTSYEAHCPRPAATECPKLHCLHPCPFAYAKDSNNCSTCECAQSCEGGCGPSGHCVMTSSHPQVFSCQMCESKACPRCRMGYKRGQDGCPSCECKDPCETNSCAPSEKCIPIPIPIGPLGYLCIDKREQPCSALVNYLSYASIGTQHSFNLMWYPECDSRGAFKRMQFLKGEATCFHPEGLQLASGPDCYKQGLLWITIPNSTDLTKNFERKLIKALAVAYRLTEDDVVVSRESDVHILLLSNDHTSQKLLLDILHATWAIVLPPSISYSLHPPLTSSTPTYTFPTSSPPLNSRESLLLALLCILIIIFILFLIFFVILKKVTCRKASNKNGNAVNNNNNGEETNNPPNNKQGYYNNNIATSADGVSFVPYKHLDGDVDV